MDYEPKDDPMGADDTGASDASRMTELVASMQAQLDELKDMLGTEEADEAPAVDEAAPPEDMTKELLQKQMAKY